MARRPGQGRERQDAYPKFEFRIAKDQKEKLNEQIEKAQAALNRRRKEGDPFVNKCDVVIQALFTGLKRITKGDE